MSSNCFTEVSKDTNGVSRRDFHPEKGKTPGYFCPEGEKIQIPGIGYWYKVCLEVYTFWLRGEVAESEHVKNMELCCRATPVQAASSMSLYTLPKKKKKPFASHKQFRIQLRKHRVNHMAGVARVGCIFPQTKKGLRVEGKEKKTQLSGWWSCCLEAMIPNLKALFQAPTETWYVIWLASFIFTRVVRAASL